MKGILRWIDVGFLFLVSFDENYPILFARKSIVEIRNIGVDLFIKRYLCWMKRDGDIYMMKIDNFINNYYIFVLIFRIDLSKVSFELFNIIIFYQKNFYKKMFDIKL